VRLSRGTESPWTRTNNNDFVDGCDRALPRCQNRQWEKDVAKKGHLW
jgi:hypothetical protein